LRKTRSFAITLIACAIGSAVPAIADNGSNGSACYSAVYDQQASGTYLHLGKGTWDDHRGICIHVGSFTQSSLGSVTGIQAAQSNQYVHVMYVIDRTSGKFYAPCGANVVSDQVPNGVLPPGTYDLDSFSQISGSTPDLGPGAACNISSN
jgi:hypothetical protein